jgi:hypothetical protein
LKGNQVKCLVIRFSVYTAIIEITNEHLGGLQINQCFDKITWGYFMNCLFLQITIKNIMFDLCIKTLINYYLFKK